MSSFTKLFSFLLQITIFSLKTSDQLFELSNFSDLTFVFGMHVLQLFLKLLKLNVLFFEFCLAFGLNRINLLLLVKDSSSSFGSLSCLQFFFQLVTFFFKPFLLFDRNFRQFGEVISDLVQLLAIVVLDLLHLVVLFNKLRILNFAVILEVFDHNTQFLGACILDTRCVRLVPEATFSRVRTTSQRLSRLSSYD